MNIWAYIMTAIMMPYFIDRSTKSIEIQGHCVFLQVYSDFCLTFGYVSLHPLGLCQVSAAGLTNPSLPRPDT